MLGWLEEGRVLTRELPARYVACERWLSVRPLGLTYPETIEARARGDILQIYPTDRHVREATDFLAKQGLRLRSLDERVYHIRIFDIPAGLSESWDADLAVMNMEDSIAFGEEDLETRLSERGIPLDTLEQWSDRYPL